MAGKEIDLTNSHYLNEKNRILDPEPEEKWGIMDADYNIQPGNTFGITEEDTLKLQNWHEA